MGDRLRGRTIAFLATDGAIQGFDHLDPAQTFRVDLTLDRADAGKPMGVI